MSTFSSTLKKIRSKYFKDSARSAWEHWQQRGLMINYPYYMRLEQGKALPSPEVVSQLKTLLSSDDGDTLIKAYCANLFPQEAYLFSVDDAVRATKIKTDHQHSKNNSLTQKELSVAQISTLASASEVYHLFLLLTLARRPLTKAEILQFIKLDKFTHVVKQLLEAKLALQTSAGLESTNPDVRFPSRENERLQAPYAKLDAWDKEFSSFAGFEVAFQKMSLRRISFRYLGLIQKQLEFVFELAKSADEMEKRYNDHVVQLQVQFVKGRLPG